VASKWRARRIIKASLMLHARDALAHQPSLVAAGVGIEAQVALQREAGRLLVVIAIRAIPEAPCVG
jgi:hypothetical protein